MSIAKCLYYFDYRNIYPGFCISAFLKSYRIPTKTTCGFHLKQTKLMQKGNAFNFID